MTRHNTSRSLKEVSEPYIDQAAWLARVFVRCSIGFSVVLSVVTLGIILAMADSGFSGFETFIAAALIVAVITLVGLSVWLAMKARVLASALESHLSRKQR